MTGDIEQFGALHAELLELGRSGRSPGVTTGATARLAHARLAAGDLVEAELLAREALAGSGSSFMPVINGYVFRSAGLVNLALGHTPMEGATSLDAIEAFSQGAGQPRRRSGRDVLDRPEQLARGRARVGRGRAHRAGGARRGPSLG